VKLKRSENAACSILVDLNLDTAMSARDKPQLLRVIHGNESCLLTPLAR
jgi:hypothetical protein